MNMDLEREFMEFARMVKYDILRQRMVKHYSDLSEIFPSVESAEEKYERAINNMTLENIEKLAQNAWLDEVEKLEC